MKLTFAIALVLVAFASAQNCDNPLLQAYNFTPLASPVSGAGLAYCANLQSGQTCCSSETVLGFQGLIDIITRSLEDLAGSRDIVIAQLRSNVTDDFRDKVSDMTDYDGDVNDIKDNDPAVGDPIKTQYDSFREYRSELDDLHDDDNFKSDFVDMQNKRVACFTTLLQIQAEAMCLACDADWATQGVQSNGVVAYADALCATIQQACAPYAYAAGKFNPLFQTNQAYDRLVGLTNWLKYYHDNDKTYPNVTLSGDVVNSTNATLRTNSIPANCTEDSCAWQCNHVFNGSFVLNQTVVANGAGIIGGGDVYFEDVGVTVVVPATSSGSRRLQNAGTWNPNIGSSGVTVTVVPDPSAVVNLDGSDASDADINDHLGGSRTSIISAAALLLCAAIIL